MMNDLKQQFSRISESIAFESITGRSATHHYPLLEIMRTVNNGSSEFNPAALENHGIDAMAFREAWANGFAKETLGYYDQHPGTTVASVIVERCKTCLDTSETDPYAFGHFLEKDMKAALQEKLLANRIPTQATAPQYNA